MDSLSWWRFRKSSRRGEAWRGEARLGKDPSGLVAVPQIVVDG